MPDNEKQKYAEFKDMSLEEFFAKLPKPTLRMRIYVFIQNLKKRFGMSSRKITHKYGGDVGEIKGKKSNSETTFRESQCFDPEKASIQRKQEDAYLQSMGFTRDDLILTPEENIKRKQEDAYFDSLPGYRKKDNERDDR